MSEQDAAAAMVAECNRVHHLTPQQLIEMSTSTLDYQLRSPTARQYARARRLCILKEANSTRHHRHRGVNTVALAVTLAALATAAITLGIANV